MQKWEYGWIRIETTLPTMPLSKTVYQVYVNNRLALKDVTEAEAYDYFNKVGKEGWELSGVDGHNFFFKRPIE